MSGKRRRMQGSAISEKEWEREARRLRATLKRLSDQVSVALNAIDSEMKQPPSSVRGSRMAKICNALEMANDRVRYNELGVDFRKDPKRDRSERVTRAPR